MYRDERLVIRLHKSERQAIERYAKTVNIPASTVARAMLLNEAERLGLGCNRNIESERLNASNDVNSRQGSHAVAAL